MERPWLEDQFKIAIGSSVIFYVVGTTLGMSPDGPRYLAAVAMITWGIGMAFTMRALKLLMYLSKLYQVHRGPYYAWIGVAISSSIFVCLALRQ
jgi:hypothetical protein